MDEQDTMAGGRRGEAARRVPNAARLDERSAIGVSRRVVMGDRGRAVDITTATASGCDRAERHGDRRWTDRTLERAGAPAPARRREPIATVIAGVSGATGCAR